MHAQLLRLFVTVTSSNGEEISRRLQEAGGLRGLKGRPQLQQRHQHTNVHSICSSFGLPLHAQLLRLFVTTQHSIKNHAKPKRQL